MAAIASRGPLSVRERVAHSAPWSRATRAAVLLVVLASGVGGAAAGCAPVGGRVIDRVLAGGLAALVALAAARSSSLSLLAGSAVVVIAGRSGVLVAIGAAALA